MRVCDTAPYPHYIDLAHYMISGLYSRVPAQFATGINSIVRVSALFAVSLV